MTQLDKLYATEFGANVQLHPLDNSLKKWNFVLLYFREIIFTLFDSWIVLRIIPIISDNSTSLTLSEY